ncbi:MAG: hypothetical protein ACYC91_10035 [Solirubrobacteraceae bacterium]
MLPHDFALWVERIVLIAALVLLLIFTVFHVLQSTTRTIHPTRLVEGRCTPTPTRPSIRGGWWRSTWVRWSCWAITCTTGWSGAQTAGTDNPDRNWLWRRLAMSLALAATTGFALVPILFGAGGLPQPQCARCAPAKIASP